MYFELPIGEWMEALVQALREHAGLVFDTISTVVEWVVGGLEFALLSIQPWAGALVVVALSALRLGWRGGLMAAAGMALVLGMDIWDSSVETLALVLSAALFSLLVGFPVGIASAKSDVVWAVVRPVLDFMQTMPPFVYLIPAILFFGVGEVPGTIATIIFAMPPAVRLTNLGIRQVSREIVEAGLAFGCTPAQLLIKVELPTARESIMAGINQTIMLALSMVVIASMIGAGGLGKEVLIGIQRLDIGLGFESGFGVVIIAILLDRLTQSFTGGGPSIRDRLSSLLFWRKGDDSEDADGHPREVSA